MYTMYQILPNILGIIYERRRSGNKEFILCRRFLT
jgi:hypothetical protein